MGNGSKATIHNGTLVKRGKQVVLFRRYDGFAFDTSMLNICERVQIHYNDRIYRADVKTVRQFGIDNDYKGERQLVLPRKYFEVSDERQARLF